MPKLQGQLVEIAPDITYPPVLAYAAMECTSSAWGALNAVATDSAESAASTSLGLVNVVEQFLMTRDHRGEFADEAGGDPFGLRSDPIYQREVETLNIVVERLLDDPLEEAHPFLRGLARRGYDGQLVASVVQLSHELR